MTEDEERAWARASSKLKDQGLPGKMAAAFLPHYYIPQQMQVNWHRLTEDVQKCGVRLIGNGGSRGSGKTTATFAQVSLYDCQQWAGTNWLYIRLVKNSAGDSFEQMTSSILGDFEGAKPTKEGIHFPNGSNIAIAGVRNPEDVDKYVGLNYEGMVIEEANQIDENRLIKLLGSLRTGRLDGYRPRCYMNFNPGGPGMKYLKKTFIQPWKEGREKNTRFIFSRYQENKFLDEGYVDYLNNLDGMLGKLWRDGDFDITAGMAFDNFRPDIYVYDDWKIGDNWIRMRGIDDGYSKPYCCLWGAKDPDTGRIVIYEEDYGEGHATGDQVERIKTMTPKNHRIMISYADPAMFSKDHHTDRSVKAPSDIYADHGIYLTRGDNDRKGGLAKIRELMRFKPDGLPGLIILSRCKNLIWQFENLPMSASKPEDVDTNFEDHAYDALRYMISGETGAPKKTNSQRQNLVRHPLFDIYRN
ncbi:MAG: phage terminase large subunit [Firmicutes bacterium]|nr:phage terminase large subunit [Bacillota bacterium]